MSVRWHERLLSIHVMPVLAGADSCIHMMTTNGLMLTEKLLYKHHPPTCLEWMSGPNKLLRQVCAVLGLIRILVQAPASIGPLWKFCWPSWQYTTLGTENKSAYSINEES